ncbi:MAG: MBOAT family O-acyltransferase, partial [Bacteroidia bacterium]
LQHHHQTDAYAERIAGFVRFCIGLGKKVLIANVMGAQADAIYATSPELVNTTMAWVAAIAYTFQIYFDFSGYSDMALGLARMMGIRLPENFNSPYIAQSITEFWRRWHITLGAWMKNYIYIPLGGNQVSAKRLYINLLLVFLISGLWHGASWNFVIWGVYHGLFLMLERWLRARGIQSKIQVLNIIYAFVVVVLGWVIFRNENLDRCVFFLQKMAAFDFSFSHVFFFKANFFPMLVFAVFFSFCTLLKAMELWQNHLFNGVWKASHQLVYVFMGLILFAMAVIYISNGGYNPFIYFKF